MRACHARFTCPPALCIPYRFPRPPSGHLQYTQLFPNTSGSKILLKAAFSHRYSGDVERLLKIHNNRLYPTYQALDESDKGLEGVPTRVKKFAGKRAHPEEAMRHSTMEAEKEALAEFDAASAVCQARARERDAKKAKEREEADNLARAKAEGTVAECGCCYDELPLNRMVHCTSTSPHWFCRGCAKRMAENVVGMSKYQLDCLSTEGCDGTFSQDQRYLFLDAQLAAALDTAEQEAVLRMAGIENLERCPFCPYAAEYPPIDENKEFRCENPKCGRVSCRLCHDDTHIPKSCEESQKERGHSARRVIEEARSAAMIRNCNKC